MLLIRALASGCLSDKITQKTIIIDTSRVAILPALALTELFPRHLQTCVDAFVRKSRIIRVAREEIFVGDSFSHFHFDQFPRQTDESQNG